MARPQKESLDYFSMDVEKDNKLKLLKAKFGVLGFGMYVELLQYIYKEGYYIKWTNDNMLLFIAETGLKEEETQLMLEFMIEKGLFNKEFFKKYNILTSSGIQKRYAEGTRKRKKTAVISQIWCAGEYEHIELMEELTELMSEETQLMLEESTQSKVKESKGNKTKTKKTISGSREEVKNLFKEYYNLEYLEQNKLKFYTIIELILLGREVEMSQVGIEKKMKTIEDKCIVCGVVKGNEVDWGGAYKASINMRIRCEEKGVTTSNFMGRFGKFLSSIT